MKMTSAYANKILRQLDEDKGFITNRESNSITYMASLDEEPVIPEYDYLTTAKELDEIDRKVQIIKHAINNANVNNYIDVEGKKYTVDTILVRMSMLNRRKYKLDAMRKMLPKERIDSSGSYSSRRPAVPEYRYANYDIELIKAEFERISNEIMAMQIALDKYNQTFEFEVAID